MTRRLAGGPAAIAVAAALAVTAAAATSSRAASDVAARSLPPLPSKSMPASEQLRIRTAVTTLLANPVFKADVPGVILGVWSPDLGVFRGTFGRADLRGRRAPGVGDSFRIGSVSSTFTATLILQLVDRGKLALGGKVKAYAPALAKRYPAIGSRTIAQLLGMRSGLPEYTNEIAKRLPRSAQRAWTADELIDVAMRSGRSRPAGGRSVFTHTNDVVLGEVAEEVTGVPVERLVRDRLLEPLGLRHTTYPAADDGALPARSTHGYVTAAGAKELQRAGASVRAGTDATGWNPSWANAAGAMSSTLDDLGRWGNGLVGTVLLSKKLQQERLESKPQTPEWTYGLGILTLTGGKWVGQEGDIPGWSTWVLHDVETGMTVVSSVNACCGGRPLGFTLALLQSLYPDTFIVGGKELPAGAPYQLSPTTSFTPTAGWLVDPKKTEQGKLLSARKRGVGLTLTDVYELTSGRTLASLVTLLTTQDKANKAYTSVGEPAAFTTASGLQGFTWQLQGPTQAGQTWLVTNGKKVARLAGSGPSALWTSLRSELQTMAGSITMAAS